MFLEASTVEKTGNGYRHSFSLYLKKSTDVPETK